MAAHCAHTLNVRPRTADPTTHPASVPQLHLLHCCPHWHIFNPRSHLHHRPAQRLALPLHLPARDCLPPACRRTGAPPHFHMRRFRQRPDLPAAHATASGRATAGVGRALRDRRQRGPDATGAAGPGHQHDVPVHPVAHDGEPVQHEQPADVRRLLVPARLGHRPSPAPGQPQNSGAPAPTTAALSSPARARPKPAARARPPDPGRPLADQRLARNAARRARATRPRRSGTRRC